MVRRVLLFLVPLFLQFLELDAQAERALIRAGNEFFKDSLYQAADSMYLEALKENPESIEAQYNYANTQYHLGSYEEAIRSLESLPVNQFVSQDQILHDIGNAQFKNQKLEEAIKAYKKALKINPKREDTRNNLARALIQMNDPDQKKKNQQGDQNQDQDKKNQEKDKNQEEKNEKDGQDQKQDQQKNQDSEKNKEGEEEKNSKPSEQQKEQENKDGGKGDGKEEDDPQKKPSDSDQNSQKQQEQKQKDGAQGGQAAQQGEMTEKEAEQILKALDDNEKQLQKRLIQRQLKERNKNENDKDW